MNRYAKRIPQTGLFGENADPDPSRPLAVDSSVFEASRLHLFHSYRRPYYFGIDDLCDASSENAEQFLRLAAILYCNQTDSGSGETQAGFLPVAPRFFLGRSMTRLKFEKRQ
jgi:hypothetical protein